MATLELTKLWINLASSGQGVSAPTIGNESVSGVEGAPHTFAGGRIRYVGKEGVGGQLERTLRMQTAATAVILESWLAQTVYVRDHLGQAWWGVFSHVKRRVIKGSGGLFDLTITIDLVTQSDGV